jgi:hypothetical protein
MRTVTAKLDAIALIPAVFTLAWLNPTMQDNMRWPGFAATSWCILENGCSAHKPRWQ